MKLLLSLRTMEVKIIHVYGDPTPTPPRSTYRTVENRLFVTETRLDVTSTTNRRVTWSLRTTHIRKTAGQSGDTLNYTKERQRRCNTLSERPRTVHRMQLQNTLRSQTEGKDDPNAPQTRTFSESLQRGDVISAINHALAPTTAQMRADPRHKSSVQKGTHKMAPKGQRCATATRRPW